MDPEDGAGEMLEDVARIPSLVDRLRRTLMSAAALDLKASTQGYWTAGASGAEEDGALRRGTEPGR